MKTEIEVKFLHVDFDDIRERLSALGATMTQPMRLMRRALLRTPDMSDPLRDGFIRVRDEGDKVTLTYKQFGEKPSLTGAKEIEVVVSDFQATLDIFAQADLASTSFQETRRETWRLGEAEVVLDEWPWVDPYIEIEGGSEELVKATAKDLGFDWNDAVFGSAVQVYQAQYPHSDAKGIISLPEAKFGAPLPDIFK